MTFRRMGISVSSGKIGMVLFVGNQPVVWKVSDKSAKSVDSTTKQIKRWIDQFRPDEVITEKMTKQSRKHGNTPKLVDAIGKVVQASKIRHVEVPRIYKHQNIHHEAKFFCERYRQLRKWLPNKRQIWQAEHRNMAIFEAVSLIENTDTQNNI